MGLIDQTRYVDFLKTFTILYASHLLLSPVYACPRLQVMALCEELVTSNGFTYQVPHGKIPDDLTGCEHGWYYANRTFFVDSTISKENSGFVVHVNPENLTVTSCENLLWQLDCDNIQFYCTVNYTVGYSTHEILPGNYTIPGDKEASFPSCLIAVIVGVVVVIILPVTIWICWGKKYKKVTERSTLPAEDQNLFELCNLIRVI